MSGEAFRIAHARPSTVTASDDWLARGISPARASAQLRQPQFHCGSPPPAAAPSTMIRT